MRAAMRFFVCCVLIALAGCAGLPTQVQRSPSSAFTDTGDTALAQALAPEVRTHPQ